jgi:NAD-dependent dihydropyrimidine dehydrogenase PreA subunit
MEMGDAYLFQVLPYIPPSLNAEHYSILGPIWQNQALRWLRQNDPVSTEIPLARLRAFDKTIVLAYHCHYSNEAGWGGNNRMRERDPNPEMDAGTVTEATPSPAPEQARKAKTEPSLRAEVVVFDNWCKGCGLCVAFCPRGVLEMNGSGKVHVIAPERCTACQWCETHCPDFAIVVRRVDETLSRRRG